MIFTRSGNRLSTSDFWEGRLVYAKSPEAGDSHESASAGPKPAKSPDPARGDEALTDEWLEKYATKQEKAEIQRLRQENALASARLAVHRHRAEQELAIAKAEHELRQIYPQGFWAKTGRGLKATVKLGMKDGLPLAAGVAAPWAPALLQTAGVNAGNIGAPLTSASVLPTLGAAAPGALLGYAAGRSLGNRYAQTAVGQTLWKMVGTTSGAVMSYNAIPYLYGLGPIGFLASPSAPLIFGGGAAAGLLYSAGWLTRKIRGQPKAGILRTMGTGLALPVTLSVAGPKFVANSWRSVSQSVHNWGWDKKTPTKGVTTGTLGLATGLLGAATYLPLRTVGRAGKKVFRFATWPVRATGNVVSKTYNQGKRFGHWLFDKT